MGYARYVGRVGALAVALGVGSAVGFPVGVAWAQSDASGDAGTSHSAEGSNPAGAGKDSSTTGSAVESGAQAPAGGAEPGSPADPGPDVGSPTASGTNVVTVGVDGSPPVVIDAPTNGSDEQDDEADPDARNEQEGTEELPEDGADTDTEGAEGVAGGGAGQIDDTADSATAEAAALGKGSSRPSTAGAAARPSKSLAAQVDSGDLHRFRTAAAVTQPQPQVEPQPQPQVQVHAEPQPEPPVVEVTRPEAGPLGIVFAPMRFVVLGVLGALGFDPAVPSSNPLFALLWGAYRRIESVFANEAPDQTGSSTIGFHVDPQTGRVIVEGQLGFTDPDFDPLTYKVMEGDATVDENGNFTVVAGDPTQPVTFTIAVSDGTSSLLGAANTTTVKYTISNLIASQTPEIISVSAPSAPDAAGHVTGTVTARDPSGAPLHAVPGQLTPLGGHVEFGPPVQAANGDWTLSYTYIPDPEAQYKAFEGAGPTTEDIRITVTNGRFQATTEPITVEILPLPRPSGPVILSVPPPSDPDVNGLVVGVVIVANDPNGAQIKGISGPTPLGGHVEFDPTVQVANGDLVLRYTYMPNPEAQYEAFEGTGPNTEDISFTVSNGQSVAVSPPVTVKILPVPRPTEDGQIPLPVGYSPVGPGVYDPLTGFGYQTILSSNPIDPLKIVVIRPDGQTVINSLPGALPIQPDGLPGGGLMFAPQTGTAYQTTSDGTQTWVSVIHPDGSVSTRDPLPGQPVGTAVADPSTDLAYQITFEGPASTGIYYVSVIHPDGSAITGDPLRGRPLGPAVTDPRNGHAYVTTVESDADTAWVNVVREDGSVIPTKMPPGREPVGPPIRGGADLVFQPTRQSGSIQLGIVQPDGSLLLGDGLPGAPTGHTAVDLVTRITYLMVSDSSSTSGELRVAVVFPDGSVAGATAQESLLPGGLPGPVAVAPGGRLAYVVTSNGATFVSVVGEDGAALSSPEPLPGTSFSSSLPVTGLVVHPLTLVAWVTTIDAASGEARVTVVDPDLRVVRSVQLPGSPVGGVTIDPRTGHIYQTTADLDGTRVTVFRPDGSVTTIDQPISGSAKSGVIVNPTTGAVYQATSTGIWQVSFAPVASASNPSLIEV